MEEGGKGGGWDQGWCFIVQESYIALTLAPTVATLYRAIYTSRYVVNTTIGSEAELFFEMKYVLEQILVSKWLLQNIKKHTRFNTK